MHGQEKKKSRKWLVVLAIVGAGLFCATLMYGFAVGFSVEPSAEERAMLPTVEDLGLLDGKQRPAGTYAKKRYIDGTWMVEYTYEDPELYMFASIGHEHSERDARTVYSAEAAVTSVAMGFVGDVELVDDPSLYRGGDDQRCSRMTSAGQTTGYVITVRRDTDVFSLFIGGVVFDDAPTVIAEMLDPMLASL